MSGIANIKEDPEALATPGMANPKEDPDAPATPEVANVKVKEDPDPFAAPDPHYDPTPKRPRTDVSHLITDHEKAGNALHELLEAKKWDESMIMIQNLRRLNGTARIPELDVHNPWEMTPLVYALESVPGAPDRVVEILVDTYTATQEFFGNKFPIHIACASKTLTHETIEKVLTSYPEAILKKTEHGENPVHIILQHKPPLKLFDTMVEVWAGQKGTDEDESWRTLLRTPGNDGMLPLHIAIQYKAPTDLILKMIEKYPDNVTKEIKLNRLPALHVAAYNGCSFEVLKSLLEHAPGIIGSKRGQEQNTPLHLLFILDHKERWVEHEEGMMPPHEMARHLLFTHAYRLENINGRVKKGEKFSPGKRAQKLVCETLNKEKATVLDYASQLKDNLFPASSELRKLLEELEEFESNSFWPQKWKMEAP
jgi:hypothetical protein